MKKLKRLFDVVFSLVILILITPFIVFIVVGIILSDGGPVIFFSKRIGYDGRIFTIYKFKTLKIKLWNKDKSLVSEKNDYRIFKFGKLLRSTHMDELPQLINVIKGDMSIVGPRPMLYGARNKNLCVLPGITGLAKIRMQKASTKTMEITRTESIYDDFYERKKSCILDLYIVFKTICVIFRAGGI